MNITFTEHKPRRDEWRFTAECPYCHAVYVERAVLRGEFWTVGQYGTCSHFRGVDRHTDLVKFEMSRYERIVIQLCAKVRSLSRRSK